MTNQSDNARMLAQWKRTATLMQVAESKELLELTPSERGQQIANLLDLSEKFLQPRTDLGLIAMKKRLRQIFASNDSSNKSENHS